MYIKNVCNYFDKLVARPLVFPAFIVLLFALVSYHFGVGVSSLLIVFILAGVLILNRNLKIFIVSIFTILICLFVGLFYYSHNRYEEVDSVYNSFRFKVVSVQDKLNDKSSVVLYSSKYGRVIWNIDTNSRPIAGTEIIVNGFLTIPDCARNPGEFNYREYLKSQGIHYIFNNIGEYIYCKKNLFNEFFDAITHKILLLKKNIVDVFENESSIVAGMFLGDTSLLDNSIRDSFSYCNCAHLLAVSGTHFTGFLAVILILLKKFKIDKVRNVVFFLLVICICFITGWTASVTRAALMALCVFYSRDSYSGLSVALLIIAIANPFILITQGFLMSFVICISIKLFAKDIMDRLTKVKINENLASIFSVALAAQIGIIPFWSVMDYRINIVLFVISQIASFIATISCTIFVPTVILALVFKIKYVTIPCRMLIRLLVKLIDSGRLYMYKSFIPRNFSVLTIIIILVVLVAYIKALSNYRTITVIVLGLLVCFGIINYEYKPDSKLVFIDVGQGDSCLIMDNNISILIDGGTYDSGEVIESVMDYYSISSIDYTFVTHWDEDHCGGIRYLYERGKLKDIYSSSYDDQIQQSMILKVGDVFSIGDSKLICINSGWENTGDDNEQSLVLEYIVNNCKILFTGDIPFNIEYSLCGRHLLDNVDVLKVAHHGSRFSSSEYFLQRTMPEYSIISVGKYNNYGHPARQTINRLEGINTNIYMTSESGAITIDVYDKGYTVTPFIV